MTKHVAAERWADLAAGRLSEADRHELEAHAAACAACAEAQRRVAGAHRAMAALGEAAPELGWETLGARLGWQVSAELRRREREREGRRGWARRWFPLALGGALATAVAAFLVVRELRDDQAPRAARTGDLVGPTEAKGHDLVGPTEARPAAPSPAPLEGVVTLVAGEVTVDGKPLALGAAVRAGMTLATRRGRAAVQLGDRTGFALEPDSTLVLAALDDSDVELQVVGAVAVEVTRRRPEQRFAVRAAARVVEVRGTVFRVAHAGGVLDVAVTRGRVAVIEGSDQVDVPAGQRLALALGEAVGARLPRVIEDAELARLADGMRVPLVPGWTTPAETRAATAELKVSAGARARVRVDGVVHGTGPLSVRTTAGRHLVEVGALSRWLEVDAGATGLADFPDAPARSERPRQVEGQVAKYGAAFASCGDRIRKHDPAFAGDIEVEIGINVDGSINFVTTVKGLDDGNDEACVLNVIRDRFTFPAGSAGTVRKKIRF